MKRDQIQFWVGGGLVVLGGLMLLEKLGIFAGGAGLFWNVLLLLAGGYFLMMYIQNARGQWWAVIPGLALLGMALEGLLSGLFGRLAGGFFLGSLGLAFFIVYISDRARWWGIIPGGVLLTLALVAVLDNATAMDTGGVFFLGLGLTFLLVALLPTPAGKMDWAYIPAVALLVMGGALGGGLSPAMTGYLWPAALIIGGVALIVRFFWRGQ